MKLLNIDRPRLNLSSCWMWVSSRSHSAVARRRALPDALPVCRPPDGIEEAEISKHDVAILCLSGTTTIDDNNLRRGGTKASACFCKLQCIFQYYILMVSQKADLGGIDNPPSANYLQWYIIQQNAPFSRAQHRGTAGDFVPFRQPPPID